MRTKLVVLTCLLLVGMIMPSFAQIKEVPKTIPQGKWEVKQVTIEKNTDGNVQITAYNTAAEMQKYPLPIEWEIKDSQTIVWYYGNGVEQMLEYSLEENDKLQIVTTTLQSYQYSINGNTMTLITTNNYKQTLHTGHTEHINEKWTIVLQQK